MIADISAKHVQPLVAALQGQFYIESEDIHNALRAVVQARAMPQQRPSLNITDRATFFRVDVFLPIGRPFGQSEFARRVHEVVSAESGQQVYVATAEDMMLAKLEWYEVGHRSSSGPTCYRLRSSKAIRWICRICATGPSSSE